MLPRWQGGVATAVVIAIAVTLVVLDAANRGVRHFWQVHPFTVDTVGGLLVLGVTVLVVDQIIRRRQVAERSRAIAAQAGIVLLQAERSVQAVQSARDGGDPAGASDEVRTYLLVLLVAAPVLIESAVARRFLEQAQVLAGEMGRVVAPADVPSFTGSGLEGGLDEAIERLRAAAAPLLSVLSVDERCAVTDGLD